MEYIWKDYIYLHMNLHIELPDLTGVSDFDVKMIVASRLYADGHISSGQASKIVGLSKTTFIELLGKYNVSFIGTEAEELEDDLQNA